MIRIDHLQFLNSDCGSDEHLTVNEGLRCNILAQTCHPFM